MKTCFTALLMFVASVAYAAPPEVQEAYDAAVEAKTACVASKDAAFGIEQQFNGVWTNQQREDNFDLLANQGPPEGFGKVKEDAADDLVISGLIHEGTALTYEAFGMQALADTEWAAAVAKYQQARHDGLDPPFTGGYVGAKGNYDAAQAVAQQEADSQ